MPQEPSRTSPVYAGSDAPVTGVLLLIEDDPDHAFLVRRRLRDRVDLDLQVVHVVTAAAATERLRVGDVRCVVVDLPLPDARGLEAVLAIRAVAPKVPVVLTGVASDALGREALKAGAQDYLVKGQHDSEAVGRSVVFAMERAQRQDAEQQQALLADRLHLLLEASAEGICWLDGDGACTFVNRAAAEVVGWPVEELLGRDLHDLVHDCPDGGPCALAAALRSAGTLDAGEQVFRRRDGGRRRVELRGRTVYEDRSGSSLVVNFNDVTVRVQAQVALAEREAQLVDAQRLARLGSWEWDLVTGEVCWSDEMYRLTGLHPANVPTDERAFGSYAALVPPQDASEVAQLMADWDSPREAVVVRHRLTRPDGAQRWFHCRASAAQEQGRPVRVLGTIQDITEQKVAEEALAHQALHDALTGLANRALLIDRLQRVLAHGHNATVAVVFLDLDRFKWVNDSLSHAAGDQLLVAVARALESALRPTDTLARFGGDEFVLLCEQVAGEDEVLDIVDRLDERLSEPFVLQGRDLTVSASMGVALAKSGTGVDAEELIRDADTAMYRAKELGRARVEMFDEQMRQRASIRLAVQHDLRLALRHGQIRAYYQPVVDLETQQVTGCEALARWEHPTRGLLGPEAFIAHAEETGLIVPVGAAVLEQACHQVARWNAGRPADDALTVSVNLSARQLSSPALVGTVAAALAHSGLPPRLLCLEITESVVMEDVAASGEVLGRLRALGVRTAVDDFGTGYSSLAYLLSLPVDLLKVDRSFVSALDGGARHGDRPGDRRVGRCPRARRRRRGGRDPAAAEGAGRAGHPVGSGLPVGTTGARRRGGLERPGRPSAAQERSAVRQTLVLAAAEIPPGPGLVTAVHVVEFVAVAAVTIVLARRWGRRPHDAAGCGCSRTSSAAGERRTCSTPSCRR
ncbi:MAG: EAL domain-containing response regulator [Mycobacteriales bacterium]